MNNEWTVPKLLNMVIKKGSNYQPKFQIQTITRFEQTFTLIINIFKYTVEPLTSDTSGTRPRSERKRSETVRGASKLLLKIVKLI